MSKQQLPKISVITVCKNSAHLLINTIESVKSQTYKNFEYLIIDGNSTDSTSKILERYKDVIDICISEDDSGIYSAMNKGIEKASGDYLLFLNAGDYYSAADVIQTFATKFGEENSDIVFGKMKEMNEIGEEIRVVGVEKPSRYYWFKYTVPHPSIAYRKSLFVEYGLYDENYKYAADYDLNLRLFFNKKVKCQHIDNVTTVFLRGGASTNDITRRIVQSERKEIHKKYFNLFERALWGIKIIRKIF